MRMSDRTYTEDDWAVRRWDWFRRTVMDSERDPLSFCEFWRTVIVYATLAQLYLIILTPFVRLSELLSRLLPHFPAPAELQNEFWFEKRQLTPIGRLERAIYLAYEWFVVSVLERVLWLMQRPFVAGWWILCHAGRCIVWVAGSIIEFCQNHQDGLDRTARTMLVALLVLLVGALGVTLVSGLIDGSIKWWQPLIIVSTICTLALVCLGGACGLAWLGEHGYLQHLLVIFIPFGILWKLLCLLALAALYQKKRVCPFMTIQRGPRGYGD